MNIARYLWNHYFPSVTAIVYLIDASDRDRIQVSIPNSLSYIIFI